MRRAFLLILVILLIIRLFISSKSPLDGKNVKLSGTLTSEPKIIETSLLVNLNNFTFFVPYNSSIKFNSYIVVKGFANGNRLEKVTVVSVRKPVSLLSKVREKILKNIKKSIEEPLSSLIAGAVLGDPNIPRNFNDKLREKGLSHVVVASGGNLAILAGFLEASLSKRLNRKLLLPLIAVVLFVYSALTGFGAPIVRALIMWLVIMLSQLLGRMLSASRALFFTLFVMLMVRPIWIFDVSFWLSVGSTFGILLFGGKIQSKLKKVPLISESISTSVSAQIGILPISIFVFHDINIFSPIWNSIVLWTVPYITIIGMVGSILSIFLEPVGRIIIFFCYPFAWYFVKIVSLNI